MRDVFGRFARGVSSAAGTPTAFIAALGFVMAWGLTGPLFGYSPGWQLVINTVTTVVTFLMVFLIQGAQNHDQRALQLKLDELLKAARGARTGFVSLENLSEAEIDNLREQFKSLAAEHEGDVAVLSVANKKD